MRGLAAALWAVFAVIVIAGGAVSLRACGILPWGINACPEPAPPSRAAIAADRAEQLRRERDDLLRSANLSPQCRIPAAAEEPPAPPPPPPPPPVEEANCQPPPTDEVVVLVDVSLSMKYDFDADPGLMRRMDELWRMMQGNPLMAGMYQRQYNELQDRLAGSPGQDRIDVARTALIELGRSMPPEMNLNLLSFAECRKPPRQEGIFPGGGDEGYERAVRGLRLRPSTALAEAIAALPRQTEAGRSADRPVNIVIVTDGEDSCGGDACAAARAMRAELPYANVSVISVAEAASANACVAEGAEGAFYYAAEIDQIAQRMRQATGQLSAEECAALEPAGAAPAEGETVK